MLKVHQMRSERSGKEIANQFIIEEDRKVTFQSYQSTIATWDYEAMELTIGIDWDYSTTTSKYLNRFIDEYTNLPKPNRKMITDWINDGTVKYDKTLQ